MALVVKSWKVTSNPAAGEPNVTIIARNSGLLSFILSVVGIDATATLLISSRHVFYEEGSLAGFKRRFVPLEHVASSFYGRVKPWKTTAILMVLSVVLGGGLGGVSGTLLLLVGVALSALYYFLNRPLTIGVIDVSGTVTEMSFSRSVIEGQEVDEKSAEDVITMIEFLIKPTPGIRPQDINLGSAPASGVMASAAPQSAAQLGRNLGLGALRATSQTEPTAATSAATIATAVPEAAAPAGCPKCGASVDKSEAFCGSCGHKLH
jgi:hypothetical protein